MSIRIDPCVKNFCIILFQTSIIDETRKGKANCLAFLGSKPEVLCKAPLTETFFWVVNRVDLRTADTIDPEAVKLQLSV